MRNESQATFVLMQNELTTFLFFFGTELHTLKVAVAHFSMKYLTLTITRGKKTRVLGYHLEIRVILNFKGGWGLT